MSLHNDILDLPLGVRFLKSARNVAIAYDEGFKDARHAAAELANQADSEREEMIRIFKWLANNPHNHINNVVYTARDMLKKLGEL